MVERLGERGASRFSATIGRATTSTKLSMQCAQAILLFYMVYVTRSSTVVGAVVGAVVGDDGEEEEQEEEEEVARCVIIYLLLLRQDMTGHDSRYHTRTFILIHCLIHRLIHRTPCVQPSACRPRLGRD
eukprot:COSAG05_NODE_152_length_15898_cov_21.995000_15_plen_129_part_00